MDVSPVVHSTPPSLFKRCVQCPPEAPQCPDCGDKLCILVPPDCETCAHMKCIDNPNPPPPSSGPSVGAIAGGVVGGVAFIILLVFFVWLFWIKKRREQQDQELREEWDHDEIAQQKRSMHLNSIQDAGSTRTRASLANSILSRASNFIQIAYIPGVTNRNGSGRNSVHAPVPPIPAAHRQGQSQAKSPLSGEGDVLFFGIDDLRGSTYSGASSIRDTRYSGNRDTRYTMQSITPSLARESVASDLYWDSAAATPMPATTAARLAPRMVSVKSSTSSNAQASDTSSAPGTPPEHIADQVKEVPVLIPGQGPSPNSSMRGKATQVTVGGKNKGRFPVRQTSDASASSASTRQHAPMVPSPLADRDNESVSTSDSGTEEHARARASLLDNIDFATPPIIEPQPMESPFFDATEMPHAAIAAASSTRPNPYASMASTVGVGTATAHRGTSSRRGGSRGQIGNLSAVLEEATKRASMEGSRKVEEGPFGDEHATGEQ